MTREVSIPNGAGLFEIRFESIGGLGAHVAGKIVASAAVLRMNLNGSHFSSYGSEKKGSVVRSFIRLAPANKAIRTEMERGVFDIEAIKSANANLIETINESLAIADEGKRKRAAAEDDLKKLEADLRDTLASAKARATGTGDTIGTATGE